MGDEGGEMRALAIPRCYSRLLLITGKLYFS